MCSNHGNQAPRATFASFAISRNYCRRAAADNSVSHSPSNRTPKARSPKVTDRRSPCTLTSEKVKEQLNQLESWKKRAHEDAEEAKKQLAEMSKKLQESEKQLDEISASKEF
ncbi:interactor of constitutive active ROPs 2, chloroplastic [Tanacetum coccineum]|uniref:Interactor of constitutive active ROPs 2, chloroplastic n=1 Tax=Tanacetum coccineum TaxID=301880 RepID=A0ABQ5E4B6_9ASTR